MKTTRHDPLNCPACDMTFDATSSLGRDAVPEPGATTICIGCETVLRFDDNLNLLIERDLDVLTRPEVMMAVFELKRLKEEDGG